MPRKAPKQDRVSIDSPVLANQNVDYLVAAAESGVAMQAINITQAGAAPLVVNFAARGLANMANANYVVFAGGETAARVFVDESTKTPTGFNVLGGANTEVINLIIVGRLAGQRAP